MTIKKKYFIVALVLSLAAGALIMFGAMEIAKSTGVGTIKIENKEYEHMKYMTDKYAKAEELWQEIKNGYYKDVKDRDLEVGMYKGIFEGLDDPYSAYMTKKEYESWMASATGEFEGVGVTFTEDDNGNYVILNTVSGSPAEETGIKAGDFILEVDGKEYTDMDALGAALRGDKGTQVKVTYSRNGEI
ncbi:MAG: PDZ domain-containing protein, partial [Eubacteriales bacterium]|nr:PDZ domain-containing protein [Eubacteriales bacterium]